MEKIFTLVKNLFTSSGKPLTAKAAYFLQAYGKAVDEESLLKELFDTIRERILVKSQEGSSLCMIEVNPEITEYVPEIISRYETLGYSVIEINDKSRINGKKVPSGFSKGSILIISWNSIDTIRKFARQSINEQLASMQSES